MENKQYSATLCTDGLSPPADRLLLAPGCLRDYHALAPFHYRAKRPATVTRVLALFDPASAPDRGAPVAVLVESMPTIHCRSRDQATAGRYRSRGVGDPAIARLNAELRCISRVIVDPRWRGLGLAVALVRQALDTSTTTRTEALAAMGRVHPLFELAGMTAYHPQDDGPVYYLKENAR